MIISELKKQLEQFEDSDLVVLSSGKENTSEYSLYPLERVMASKLIPDKGDDILCALFWPAINEM